MGLRYTSLIVPDPLLINSFTQAIRRQMAALLRCTIFLATTPERVKNSRFSMSAAAAAFADSGRGEAALRQAPSDRILFVRLRWCGRTDASIDIASASVTPSSDTL